MVLKVGDRVTDLVTKEKGRVALIVLPIVSSFFYCQPEYLVKFKHKALLRKRIELSFIMRLVN